MNGLDIFALTSIAEGASLVTAEAMATGLPIVSTDVGSLSDIVLPGQNGFLVPVDDIQGMANAIRILLDDDARAQMGQRSRQIIESSISAERCAGAHIQAYRALVSTRHHIQGPD
jgi:glycosyltransferase involved in cell wall biosynthesis